MAALLLIAHGAAADSIDLLNAAMAMPGSGRIHGGHTGEHLRFSPGAGPAIGVDAHITGRFTADATVSRVELPVGIRHLSPDHDRVALITGTAAVVAHFPPRPNLDTYAGGGIVYMLLRHGALDMVTPDLHITHLAQPDHPAVLLLSGARLRMSEHWSVLAEARYGPAASTVEVFTAGMPHEGLQANFHPLIVTTGIGRRF